MAFSHPDSVSQNEAGLSSAAAVAFDQANGNPGQTQEEILENGEVQGLASHDTFARERRRRFNLLALGMSCEINYLDVS